MSKEAEQTSEAVEAEDISVPQDTESGQQAGGERPDASETAEEAAQPPTSPLSAAIAQLQRQKAEFWDRLLRNAAEFDNYKKRSKRDAAEQARRAEERVVLEFLPVIDNLERALAHLGDGDADEDGGLVDGVKMVHKQFLNTLEKYDIKPFESVDQAFDPEFHEAIQQMPSDKPSGTVVHELQRGYRRGERLVRPALVVVSAGPAEDVAPPEADEAPVAGDGPSSPTEEQ